MKKNYNDNEFEIEFDYDDSNADDDFYESDLDELSLYDNLDDMNYDEEDKLDENYDIYDDDFREVILTLDDDTELKCVVVAQFDVKGQDYIALMPVEDDSYQEILLYRAEYGEGEEFEVSLIEDQEEFDIVSDAYYENVDFDFDEYLEYQGHHDHNHDHNHLHHNHNHLHHQHNHDFDEYSEFEDDLEDFEEDYDDFEDDYNDYEN